MNRKDYRTNIICEIITLIVSVAVAVYMYKAGQTRYIGFALIAAVDGVALVWNTIGYIKNKRKDSQQTFFKSK
ncbi:MAG: hypothetical protein J6J58_00250 [Oscillospiraceae bacterium]|nr:hypothetical protein [Oscillospiraceae bacterium]MBP1552631.1 hypothetical protein [Oscillospiraceae bacterium]MBP1571498.1 hypothetical protein [Oscillospiraceae bacterium]MBQ5323859.1 hypothetical protein [Oscillospiraceae bacterium]